MSEKEAFEAWWDTQNTMPEPLSWKIIAWNGWLGRSQHAPEGDAFQFERDYRKVGVIKASCPRCLMNVYLPEPRIEPQPMHTKEKP